MNPHPINPIQTVTKAEIFACSKSPSPNEFPTTTVPANSLTQTVTVVETTFSPSQQMIVAETPTQIDAFTS